MKKLIFSLLIVLIGFSAKTQLVAGDIAFIGYNEDLPVDGFSIITLNSIPGGQQIYFTDKGIATATTWTANSEDHWLFTAPAAGISCGTVISFTENVTDVITITGISGATMVHQSGTGLFNLVYRDGVSLLINSIHLIFMSLIFDSLNGIALNNLRYILL